MSNKNKRKKNKKTRKKRGGDGEKGSVCAVCLENTATHRFCKHNHYFCVECIRTILNTNSNNKTCPLCRGPYIPPHTDPGMGQWVKEDGYLDISVQFYDGPLIPLYKYGDCCTECEKPGCWGRLCGETENKCNPCIKDELGHIVGVDRNKKYKCKKERYTRGGRRKKKTRKKGGVKVTKSPRKKTAIEIHREKLNNPEFKKRLFATSDTRVQIYEKEAKKRHDLIIKKMWNKFMDGYKARFGTPNEDDNKVMRILKMNFTGQPSKIRPTPEDIKYVKDYRAQNAENRAKGHYIYKEFKNMFDMKKKMSTEFRRKREGFRKWDEQDSDGETTGEIALLEKNARERHGGLEYLPPGPGRPYGEFHKLPSTYEGNLGKTSPVEFVDIGKSEFEIDDDDFNDKLLRRGGKRTRRRRKNKRKNKTKKNKSTKKMDKDFKPNLTPRQMFTMGSFGGTYWRPIKSKFHNTILKNKHKKYSFLKGIPDNLMTTPFDKYDVKLNKYKKKVGTTLKFWENKGWMRESHPYGWVQWYCDYYSGKRSADDARQIKRWQQLAGPNGRFRKWLVTMILKKGGKWDDESISPAIRQTLQHWGYKLTKKDFENEVKSRKK